MKKISIAQAAAGGALLVLFAVAVSMGRAPDSGDTWQPAAGRPGGISIGSSVSDQVRDIWLSMADDPLHHMSLARELELEDDLPAAARQLEVSASELRWGRLYTRGSHEGRDFNTTAQELESAARRLRRDDESGLVPLDRTLSTGLRALAVYHADMAMEQWRAGEHTRAALLLRASADEVGSGFSLFGAAPGGTIERALGIAGTVADRLDSRSPPDEREVRDAVEGLRGGAASLAEVLGSLRR